MLEIRALNVTFSHRRVLTDLYLSLVPGTLTALIGKNGCGKSTLIRCIGGQCAYDGQILLNGQDLGNLSPREQAKQISILPQKLASPHMTVEDLVDLGRNPYLHFGQRPTERDKNAVMQAIDRVGIQSLRDCFLDELSGGERQKAYLAMILAQDTPLMILDEPTTYMDLPYAHHFLQLLNRFKLQEKKTILLVLHDLNSAVRYADRIAVMDSGTILAHADTEDMLKQQTIEHLFQIQKYEVDGHCFFDGL